jgi:hypothetical protein
VRVQDGEALDQSHAFVNCSGTGGRVKCKDTAGSTQFKADFRPLPSTPSVFRFKVSFLRLGIDGPFTGPVKVTLTHNSAVVRVDSIVDCRQRNSGLKCREF